MRRLRWSANALDDVDRIAAFNEARSERYARRVQDRLIVRAQTLTSVPGQGRPVGDFRSLSVPDIQYVLDYRIADEEIVILAVRSTKEDRSWRP